VALLVQAVLGGLTVIWRLPDAISSAHLGLAYAFLALAVVLALATGPGWHSPPETDPVRAAPVRRWAVWGAGLVFAQSLVGAWVRHTEAGMACPDIPLCLGEVIPPLANGFVALHFSHRLLGYLVFLFLLAFLVTVRRQTDAPRLRVLALAAATGVALQVALGFASVYTTLGVVPVSLHTLVAASILALLTGVAALTWPRTAAGFEAVGEPVSEVSTVEG
jgi:heme A synthase